MLKWQRKFLRSFVMGFSSIESIDSFVVRYRYYQIGIDTVAITSSFQIVFVPTSLASLPPGVVLHARLFIQQDLLDQNATYIA